MSIPFREALLPRLRAAFPDLPMRVEDGGPDRVVFPARHPEVGDLEIVIQDDSDELTVFLGEFTHLHFDCYGDFTDDEKAKYTAIDVVDYLRKVFADEIEFYGGHAGGGARPRDGRERGFLSKHFFGKRTYVWSGPLDET